ncbi:MAG: hypothetical protein ACFE8U_07575 [Candidatus Hermodarchaeota archaeon]
MSINHEILVTKKDPNMFPITPIIKPVVYTFTQKKLIEKQDIHLFWVKTNPDKLHPLPSLPLEDEEVYLVINQALRKIFLWVGVAAPARSKFVGAHSANVIQRKTGIVYRVENVEQQSESSDFLQTLSVIES